MRNWEKIESQLLHEVEAVVEKVVLVDTNGVGGEKTCEWFCESGFDGIGKTS